MKPFFNWLRRIENFLEKCNPFWTPEKIDAGLRKIETENVNLSEMEILKLKNEFLDKVDREQDAELKRIEKAENFLRKYTI